MTELPKITLYALRWFNAARQRHRDGDYPAVIHLDGGIEYFKNDKRHRDGDKPAVIDVDGSVLYYNNGDLLYAPRARYLK
jgi:hypothetical protein